VGRKTRTHGTEIRDVLIIFAGFAKAIRLTSSPMTDSAASAVDPTASPCSEAAGAGLSAFAE
jgi:hypothetical protein